MIHTVGNVESFEPREFFTKVNVLTAQSIGQKGSYVVFVGHV